MSSSRQTVLGNRFVQMRQVRTSIFSWRRLLSLVVVACLVMTAPFSRADVIGEGDVSPDGPVDLPIGGGATSEDVIVGDTDPGRLTIDVPAFTDPLESPNGIIGNMLTGIGEATVSGFDLDQSEWSVELILTVASAGQGFLNVTSGGKVSVGDNDTTPDVFTMGDILVGDLSGGQGFVNVDGFASTLETFNLTVADEGFGTVVIRNRGQLRTVMGTIGLEEDSIGKVTLTGPGTRWINSGDPNVIGISTNDIIIGENGRGRLEILDSAIATTEGDVNISRLAGSRGVVLVSGEGSLLQVGDDTGLDNLTIGVVESGELHIDHGGLVRVDDAATISDRSLLELDGGTINSSALFNNGIVRGGGRIESVVSILSSGELRNAADIANLRERLLVTGAVTNDGTIESLGGEMEFEAPVANNFELVARDAVMRFRSGLLNNGRIALGGDTTLHGPISSLGDILVMSDSESLIVGDLTFSASALTLTVGNSTGTLDVLGSADLGSSLLQLDYSAGVAAQIDDSYDIFSASSGLSGSFLNPTAIADGLIWDITYSSTTVTVTASSIANIIGPDFNADGIVDAIDLAIWEANHPINSGALPEQGDSDLDGDVDIIDFLRVQRQYGMAPVPLVAALAAVPEPSTLALLMFGAIGLVPVTTRRCSERREIE